MTRARRGPAIRPDGHDLLVRQRLAGVARPGVGDQRDAADLETDPAGGDALEHGRHPDRVTAEPGQHPDLGRGLVGRAGQPHVDAFLERDPLRQGGGPETRTEGRAPRFSQVREPRTELICVRADQRAATGEVDVVAHHHQRPRPEARVQASGRIRQDDQPRTELLEQQDRLDDQTGVVALVQMEAALEHDDRAPAEATEQQRPACPGAVAAGQPGSSANGIATGSASSSASSPRPEPSTIPTSGTSGVRARTAATRAASLAGCSIGGIGRVGSMGVVGVITGLRYASRLDGRGRSFTGPTEVSTPGCRSRPVGRVRSGRSW